MKKTIFAPDINEVKRFSPDENVGLSDEQVKKRIDEKLVNVNEKKYSKSYLSIVLSNVCTFFNLLGLVVCVALLAIGAQLSRFFFVLIYLANIAIGILQEVRAKISIDRLSLLSAKKTKVLRNGEVKELLPTEIVLDDIILLSQGSQIPTDSILVSGFIEVNESLLTGESVAVKKEAGDFIYAGSFITSGNCVAKAEKVGKYNYVSTLSEKAKKYKKPSSELMRSLKWIIKAVGFSIVPLAAAFIIKSFAMGNTDWITAVDGTATVVIGMIPSGMILLTSVALAVGVVKLATKKTLVQDLFSLEMLARVDVICFDKTGTITDGKMCVHKIEDLTEKGFDIKPVVSSMLAALNDTNQTATALENYFGKEAIFSPVRTLPFNSKRKLSAVTFESGETYAFGAPEFVLKRENLDRVKEKIDGYAAEGYRVLCLAKSKKPLSDDGVSDDFEPLSLIVISDNVRAEAVDTVSWFKNNNVAIKVISGDNPITVSEVAKRAGIEHADKYISLEGLSDDEVYAIANDYTVFGRVSPEQKAILVKAIKYADHVVAMTGDGVNDILALKEADCAITVASGSEATRNVSHLVLMDDNFNSMPKVVYEGRRVINNIQCSASIYLMKTLFTAIMAILTLCTPYLKEYPFKLSQMIMIEVFVIGLPTFFLSLQPNDALVQGRFIREVFVKAFSCALLMVINAVVVEIFRLTVAKTPLVTNEAFYTLAVLAFTYAGLISLLKMCLPLNKYRAVLYFATSAIIIALTALTVTSGMESALSLVKLTPFNEFWYFYVILGGLIIIDFPLLYLLSKLVPKIKILGKHVSEKKKIVKEK